MKYILVTKCDADEKKYENRIYKLLKYSNSGNTVEVELLEETDAIPEDLGESIPFDKKDNENWKDVTEVYKKIVTLSKQISKLSVNQILQKFEGGEYPNRKDFELMNRLWKQSE